MRTTLNLEESLYHEAVKATGVQEKTRLIHMGLQTLIQEAARRRLARLYGSSHAAKAPSRRKIAGKILA
ncbi:MAG: type II toxin-antitoxin system VapB family antitoxin [Deltaproteobacteria bacterium]|nr:type II toxin-antitoxin system VapB family antitoxin [Deltaproteobacteria bacterium]